MEEIISEVYYIIITGCALFGAEIIYRVVTILCEYKNKWRNYADENILINIIKFGCYFNSNSSIILIICIIFMILIVSIEESGQYLSYFWRQLVFITFSYLLLKFSNFGDSYIEKARWIRQGEGLDYGSGMAGNYFSGYLNFILTDNGGDSKSLHQRLTDYESKEKVVIPVKRLFILIPDNLFVPPNIHSKHLEKAKDLATVEKQRAGVRRPFTNGIYKIKDTNWYVAIEGATPLVSYYNALQNTFTATIEMNIFKKEIVLQFYKTLKSMLRKNIHINRDPICELLFYNEFLPNGKPTDIGLIVKNRIRQILEDNNGELLQSN